MVGVLSVVLVLFLAFLGGAGFLLFTWLKRRVEGIRRRRQARIERARRQDRGREDSSGAAVSQISAEQFSNETCPICLSEPPSRPLVTNCGHVYCAECFMAYGQSLNGAACKCPMCRRLVTLVILHPEVNYTDEQVAYFTSFLQTHRLDSFSLLQSLMDVPPLLRVLYQYLTTGHGLRFIIQARVVTVAIAAFVYSIFPVDLLPEAVLGVFGLIDDGFVLLSGALYVAHLFRDYLQTEQLNRLHPHRD